jgi:starch synthase
MVRFALFLLSLVLPGIAGAQTRVAAPAEIRLSLPSAAVSAPSILTPAPLTGPSFAPSAFTAAPALAAPSISAAAAPLAAAPAAAALPALPAAAAPAALPAFAAAAVPAAAPADAPAAALPGTLGAVSAIAPERDEAPAAAAAKAAAAFDGRRPLNILIAGAEAVPFIKTGGLADVVDALARGLAARGHEVMMVLPKYRQLKLDGIDLKPAGKAMVNIGGRRETASLLTAKVNGVNVVLLDHPEFYDRPGGPYDGNGSSYSQDGNDERFAFFSGAALEAARTLGFKPDIAHAHDWHAALIPAFLKLTYAADPFFATTRSVMTIHNIAYQGIYTIGTARKLGFDTKMTMPMQPLEFWGYTNFLKAGIALADAVTTVSPTYADEIRRGPEFGVGLEGALNARPDGVHGILNGLDAELWDPATDRVLARNYGPDDVAEGKAENKAWLQKRLGLEEKPDAPLFAIASRLAHQKGIDLVLEAIDEIVARGGQVVVTGSGDKPLEKMVADAVARHPGAVASHPFDESFVRAVYAAADFLFMPSRFEPCGLSQLIAHRYGTLPIVTRTGGLSDTVRDLRDDAVRGDGIFIRDFTVLALVEAAEAAIAGYSRPEVLAAARATAMSNDASWGPALDAYEALYRRLIGAETAKRSASDAPASGDKTSSTNSASDARRDGSTAE